MTTAQPTLEPKLNALHPGKASALRGAKCAICQLPLKVRESIDEMLTRGDAVSSVIRFTKKHFKTVAGGIGDDVYYSHRRRHLQAIQRATAKLSDGQRMVHQRVKLARAVLAGTVDPQAYFGPAALAADIAKTSVRLDLAADQAFENSEHASLASLSGQLLRSAELRAKLGGSIREGAEVNVNIGLGDLHARLDNLLGAPADERQNAARALLGLAPPASTSSPPINAGAGADDLANPDGPLTIDVEANPPDAVSMSPIGPPAALAAARAADQAHASQVDQSAWPPQPAPFHDGDGLRRPLAPASASNRPMSRPVEELRRGFDEPSSSADAAWRR